MIRKQAIFFRAASRLTLHTMEYASECRARLPSSENQNFKRAHSRGEFDKSISDAWMLWRVSGCSVSPTTSFYDDEKSISGLRADCEAISPLRIPSDVKKGSLKKLLFWMPLKGWSGNIVSGIRCFGSSTARRKKKERTEIVIPDKRHLNKKNSNSRH